MCILLYRYSLILPANVGQDFITMRCNNHDLLRFFCFLFFDLNFSVFFSALTMIVFLHIYLCPQLILLELSPFVCSFLVQTTNVAETKHVKMG